MVAILLEGVGALIAIAEEYDGNLQLAGEPFPPRS
jgi:hypothetical protein